jgi:hypothetical protein
MLLERTMTQPFFHDQTDSESNRDDVLSILEEAIRDTRDRTRSREIETLEDERMQIRWYRTLGYLSGQYRKLQKDTDIDEMEDDLELLREVTDVGMEDVR